MMKAALLVIDMQNDYLYDKRKSKFSYNTQAITSSVNKLIRKYSDSGSDVIYIRHIIQNFPTNRLLFGFSIEGTEGAELYSGLDVVSEYCFDKLVGNALSNKKLRKLIEDKGYEELHICGLDECGCVAATALGTAKAGISAKIIRSGTATRYPEQKVAKTRRKLEKAGVKYIS